MALAPHPVTVDDVLAAGAAFDAVIDVRSPAEFAEDHLPGAVNWPVLDDDERRIVGTLYVQTSPLAARKLGAALVSRRIADILEAHIQDKPKDWRPLVYCWRGGQRSGSLGLVLAQIGFRTAQLRGGYKAFRERVRNELLTLPARVNYRVLCGRTGSGKTRLLQALQAAGAQVLDLEGLAHHRGSVLGGMPGLPQPSQKHFDTRVWQALRGFSAERPVFVESESARIGQLRVPQALLDAMHQRADCVRVETPLPVRTAMLLADYDEATRNPEPLCKLLDGLIELRGRERVGRWQALARSGQWQDLIGALISDHYDPLYERSMRRSFAGLEQAPQVAIEADNDIALAAAAAQLLALPSGRT